MAKKAKPTEKSVAMTSPRIRNKGLRLVRVADIEDNPLNFRKHPEAQRAAFAGIETELGFYGYPDFYETEQGTIRMIDGQLRKEHLLAKYGNDAEIEVNMTDFDEDEAKKALLTHDPISAMAEEDRAILGKLMDQVTTESDEISKMLEAMAEGAGLFAFDGEAGENSAEDEWQGMPEFENNAIKEEKLIVYFQSAEDKIAFGKQVKQKLTEATKFVWFPKESRPQRQGVGVLVTEQSE
jgi:hypothetical protein